MIYWVTQTINTSIRCYAENTRASYGEYGPKPRVKAQVPTGVSVFRALRHFQKNGLKEWLM
jgi:hypothetical protein